MDLLVLNHRDPHHPQAGGAEVVLHEVLKRLIKYGVSVTWMSERFNGAKTEEELDGIHIKRAGGSVSLHGYAIQEARKHDAVIDSVAHAAPFLSYLANNHTIALMHSVHQDVLRFEVDPFKAALLRSFERLVKHYPKIVAVSQTTANQLTTRLGVNPNKILVIHPGIDHDKYKPGTKGVRPTILWIGRMMKYKNPLDAVSIYLSLSPETLRKTKLIIVGEGELRGQVEQAARKAGATYLGRVSEQYKIKLYQEAWVLLSTSYIEGWGMTVVEANACGTPVVGYATGSIPEIIKQGVNGYTVGYKQIGEAARKIEEIINAPQEERQTLYQNSNKESLKYDWYKTTQNYYQLIKTPI
ncbi:MAG: glycosyltransferase family 4 protein [Thermoprotei archaeon]